jgi:type VI protein secretion system component VasK
LWPAGATVPRFDFTLKVLASEALPVATFTMDGQVSRFTRTFAAAQRYSWVGGTAREVRLSVEVRGREQPVLGYDGPWALFKLLQRAMWRTAGSTSLVQWPVTVEGQASALQAELNLGAARPILKGDYFAGFSCVSQIVP